MTTTHRTTAGNTHAVRYAPLALAGALAAMSVASWVMGRPLGIDVSVYRAGALAVVHGDPLYGWLPLPEWSPEPLPFLYPPFAALLLLPLAALPVQLAWGCMAVASAFALSRVLRLITNARMAPSGFAVLLVAVLCLQPVWRTLGLGQVNIVLMALVTVDVLALRGSRAGGVLIGLAAAVKLTPLFFILHLLVTGRVREALRAVSVFAAATAVGAAVLPGDSFRYWTSQLFGGFVTGHQVWAGNQSLAGLAHRLVPSGAAGLVHVGLAVLCTGVALGLARYVARYGDHRAALLVSATCALLISPISWTEHWVWAAPAVAYLAACTDLPHRIRATGLLTVVGVFTGWFIYVVPNGQRRELTWNLSQLAVGDAYVLAGIAVIALVVAASRQPLHHCCPSTYGFRQTVEFRAASGPSAPEAHAPWLLPAWFHPPRRSRRPPRHRGHRSRSS
ncbi:glycosyltransferase 87 family protein [Amycolatopsis sp. NPDC004368]